MDPLVEMDLMTGIEEDPEERVSEVPIDDLEQDCPRLTNMNGFVPLGDRSEVWADQPVDIVVYVPWQLAVRLGYEAGATVESAPDAECNCESITA